MARYADLSNEAMAEFNEAVDWYAERSQSAALGFVAAIEKALEKIVAAPQSFPGTYAGCRYCRLPHYPFQVVFFQEAERLVVVAIAHAKRQPGYWRDRLHKR
jgi:plasmid stabilization system protein ParE